MDKLTPKLLGLILDDDKEAVHNIEQNGRYIEKNCIGFQHYGKRELLNKDTLGRLCKEWLFNFQLKDDIEATYIYTLHNNNPQSTGHTWDSTTVFTSSKTNPDSHDRSSAKRFTGSSELEAIIKATEWVAKEKGLL